MRHIVVEFYPWNDDGLWTQLESTLTRLGVREPKHADHLASQLWGMAQRARGNYSSLLARRHKPRWVKVGPHWVRPCSWGLLIHRGRRQPPANVGRGYFHPATYDWPGVTIHKAD